MAHEALGDAPVTTLHHVVVEDLAALLLRVLGLEAELQALVRQHRGALDDAVLRIQVPREDPRASCLSEGRTRS